MASINTYSSPSSPVNSQIGGGAGGPTSLGNAPPLNTLDEPVWATVKRDLKRRGANLVLVVFPFSNRDQQSAALRNWDLWGPMVSKMCLHDSVRSSRIAHMHEPVQAQPYAAKQGSRMCVWHLEVLLALLCSQYGCASDPLRLTLQLQLYTTCQQHSQNLYQIGRFMLEHVGHCVYRSASGTA